jgi:hypothetical protein
MEKEKRVETSVAVGERGRPRFIVCARAGMLIFWRGIMQ